MSRIVVTGPESTGKTTLARYLARQTHSVYVPEFAREYLDKTKGRYKEEDLLKIAEGQVVLEAKLTMKRCGCNIIADTDLLVIKIWAEHKYGRCNTKILNLLNENLADLYLLCFPDLPWEPDPQRENPDKGIFFFQWFERELKSLKRPYFVVKGAGVERHERALEHLDREVFGKT